MVDAVNIVDSDIDNDDDDNADSVCYEDMDGDSCYISTVSVTNFSTLLAPKSRRQKACLQIFKKKFRSRFIILRTKTRG